MIRSDDPRPCNDALVAAARGGNAAAFEQLLRRHEGRVLRLLLLLGVPAQEREDVAQDIFLRVFRYLRGFRAGRSFDGWLYRITVNAAHDHRRRGRLRRRGEGEAPSGAAEQRADSAPGPAEQFESGERQRRLMRALGGLTERERAVFVLAEIEGLETRGVARSLGITSTTVRRHLGRARQRLERLLGDEGTVRQKKSRCFERPGRAGSSSLAKSGN